MKLSRKYLLLLLIEFIGLQIYHCSNVSKFKAWNNKSLMEK